MSALLNTLPGDIPGLLRHGSPVLWADEPCLVQCSRDGAYQRVDGDVMGGTPDAAALLLDLTDPTGCVHAAWWVRAWISSRGGWSGLTAATLDLLVAICDGHPMTPTQIDSLARLVLRLAKMTP